MKNILLISFLILSFHMSNAQWTNTVTAKYYKIASGESSSIRFWGGSDHYQISMSNSTNFKYGPVSDYSIKTTMYRSSTHTNRGWTWGERNKKPVIAMRTDGTMQIAKDFYSLGKIGIGTTSPGYKLHAKGDIYADGGWMRVSGQRGIYFESYGGGFYMTDNSWIRTYGNKNFYHNTGIMRTDGAFQVGGNGDRFLVGTDGKVGIGTIAPSDKLDVNGTARIRSLASNDGLTQVVVADANGKLFYRDAGTISGGTGTDDQKIDELSFTGTSLSISLEEDGEPTKVVDLAGLQDGYEANTDNQDLVLLGNDLSLTNDATSIDLSGYLDNTDAQSLSLNANTLSLTNGGDVDLSSFSSSNDNHTASEIAHLPITNLNSTDVQGALEEVAENIFWKEQLPEGINFDGKVGINMTSATHNIPTDYALAVNGNIITEEVNVLLETEWPDYVFEQSYELESLERTEEFITQNKHLPNIPSAAEVQEKGINVGEMNAALLRKIEELTLHLIEQNKQIEKLVNRVGELESK